MTKRIKEIRNLNLTIEEWEEWLKQLKIWETEEIYERFILGKWEDEQSERNKR